MLGRKISIDDHNAQIADLTSANELKLEGLQTKLDALQSEKETAADELATALEANTALTTTNEELVAEIAQLKNKPPVVAGAAATEDDHVDTDLENKALIDSSSWNRLADKMNAEGTI